MKYTVHHSWDVSIWKVEANNEEEARKKVNDYYDKNIKSDGAKIIDGYGPAIVGVYEEI